MKDEEIIPGANEQRIVKVILIGITIPLFVLFYLDTKNRRKIKSDFEKTFGTLTNYKDVSSVEGNNVNIEYNYSITSKVYSRKIRSTTKFQKCQNDPLSCIGKKYWVIYQKDRPENSLINMKFELEEGKDSISFPISLDDFF